MATHHLKAAIVLLAGVGLCGTAQAGQNGFLANIGSSAFGIGAYFVSAGTGTGLWPAPQAGFGKIWQTRRNASLGTLNETLGIVSAGQQIATLQVTASNLAVRAVPAEWRTDSIEPSASGSIGSVTITLQAYPPPASGPVPAPLLSITGTGIAWQASDTKTGPNPPAVAGSASFTSMTITGSLVNDDHFNVTGSVAANDSFTVPVTGGGSVTITFDRQVTNGVSTCGSTCTFTPSGITTKAVAIHFDQAAINSAAVSGDLTIGEANAHVRP